MFITKKHLSRRTVLRGARRRRDQLAVARRDGARRERRAAGAAAVRRGLRAERHSAGDLHAAVRRQARAAAAARAVRAAARAHQRRDGAARTRPVRTSRHRLAVVERRYRETDAGLGRASGSDHRSAHRRRDRPRHAAALARARHRGHQQLVELVPIRLELPVPEHVVLADGDACLCRTSRTRRARSSECSATSARPRSARRASRARPAFSIR